MWLVIRHLEELGHIIPYKFYPFYDHDFVDFRLSVAEKLLNTIIQILNQFVRLT